LLITSQPLCQLSHWGAIYCCRQGVKKVATGERDGLYRWFSLIIIASVHAYGRKENSHAGIPAGTSDA
ncbi:MAG TPA: hypothetical protein PLE70_08725, partial [Methanolinea sp.]|nr:hypothetical protein [Methanolinea sp.]